MEKNKKIRLCTVGDIALGGVLESYGEQGGRSVELFSEVKSFLAKGDLVFANLDCTFDTTGTPPKPEEYLVSAPPAHLDMLRELGIEVVSQANNHSLDFGATSLLATQDHLRERGLSPVGAGVDLGHARRGHIVVRDGLRLGFLAYASTHPWVGALAAEAGSAGVAPLDPEVMEEDVAKLVPQVDCLVVSVHWGKEFIHYPPPHNRALAHQLIDWGAHLVLGHHPHVIQGMEHYGHGVICYSLGNFLFPDYPDQGIAFAPEQRDSLLCTFAVGRDGIEVEDVVVVRMDSDCRLRPLTGTSGEAVIGQLQAYSAALQQEDYPRFWRRQVRRAEARRLWRVAGDEVFSAGWRGGAGRLLRLGRKNFKSIGRSLFEIVGGSGKGTAQ